MRYMVIARLYLSLQLRWRHWEYRHMACSDLSNIQANLVSVILLALLIALIGPSMAELWAPIG